MAGDIVASGQPRRTTAHLLALGGDVATLECAGHSVRLRLRFAEIVVLLALHPQGVSAGTLGALLSDGEPNQVTVRAEMSRLRHLLGASMISSRPYGLTCEIDADFFTVRQALRDGRLRTAARYYAGPLVPGSRAPGICRERESLARQLRAAVLASRDPELLRWWVDAAWGAEDLEVWQALVAELPEGSHARAAAAAQARAVADGAENVRTEAVGDGPRRTRLPVHPPRVQR